MRSRIEGQELSIALGMTLIYLMSVPLLVGFTHSEAMLSEVRFKVLQFYYFGMLGLGFWSFSKLGLRKIFELKIPLMMWVGLASVLISVLLGSGMFSPIVLMAPFFCYLLFEKLRPSSRVTPAWIYLASIFLILPIFLLPLEKQSFLPFSLYSLDTFRGFSVSRTDYGCMAGLTVIWALHRPFRYSKWAIILIAWGIMMSGSRAALLATLAGCGVYAFKYVDRFRFRTNSWIGLAGLIVLVMMSVQFFMSRQVGFWQDSGGRSAIALRAWDTILLNPWFGQGHFFQAVFVPEASTWVEVHNSILQSLLNFGFLPTFFWFALIFKFFSDLNLAGRSILAFWGVFGLFHPGFDAFLFVPESNLAFLLAAYLGREAPA